MNESILIPHPGVGQRGWGYAKGSKEGFHRSPWYSNGAFLITEMIDCMSFAIGYKASAPIAIRRDRGMVILIEVCPISRIQRAPEMIQPRMTTMVGHVLIRAFKRSSNCLMSFMGFPL